MDQIPSTSEPPFRIIAETASDAIITIDQHSTIVFVNAAAARIFGYAISEMLGRPMTMLMPEYLRHVHETGLHRYVTTGQRHIRWEGIELPGLHKSGRIISLEISFGEFVVDGHRLFTGIARDITQRAHEQRLRAAYTAAVRILAEHPSPESVLQETLRAICRALEWKIALLWNTDTLADVLRLAASWCEGEELSEFVRESERFNFRKGIGLPGRVWASKEPARIAELSEDNNFPRLTFATRVGLRSGAAFPIIAHGEVIAVMEFFSTEIQLLDRDLHDTFMTIGHHMGQYMERTQAQQALARSEIQLRNLVVSEIQARRQAEAASRMKDEFLAVLSHELRTPLTAVFGWVQMLQSRALDASTRRRALEVIERNIRVQAQLIDDLLNLSQIVTGKLQIRPEPVDALQLVQTTVETVRPSAHAKRITLQFDSALDTATLSADPARLQQIVWNLLSNAVKFTPIGGMVTVSLRQSGDEMQIVVADTGEGISPEFLPLVFDRFSQADTSTTRRHGGLGLGLALVRQLVELHGGTISAESQGTGMGSTFTIALPLGGGAASFAASETPLARKSARGALEGVKVLLVEDEPDTREMIAYGLQQFGASVAQAASAAEALREFVSSTPDILVSDIGMPDTDGYQLLEMIHDQTPQPPPAVALTAYATPADKERALRSGFQAHVSKPVELPELVSVLAGLLKRAS